MMRLQSRIHASSDQEHGETGAFDIVWPTEFGSIVGAVVAGPLWVRSILDEDVPNFRVTVTVLVGM
jgi:hypothetical protein